MPMISYLSNLNLLDVRLATIQLKSDSGESLNIVASNASAKPTMMHDLCSATFQLRVQFD